MKSIFEQKITHKSLSFILDDSAKLVDLILDSDEGEDIKAKLKMKNVCAQLGESLIDRLESTLGILNMSKREFLELAIIEALDKADLIMHDVGLHDFLKENAKPSAEPMRGLKIGDIIEKDGETYVEVQVVSQSLVDSDHVEGDISKLKVGDILEKRGDKYVKVGEAA